jgi:hypothetical protein
VALRTLHPIKIHPLHQVRRDPESAPCCIRNRRTQLILNGNPFNSFADLSRLTLPIAGKTVLDGEIVCLGKRGRPQ